MNENDEIDEMLLHEEEARLSAWIEGASREDLIAKVRELSGQLRANEDSLWSALRPARDLIDGVGVFNGTRIDKPLSVVDDVVQQLIQARRRRSADGQVEKFLCDYRPDVVALLTACRRHEMRLTNSWPPEDLQRYVANPLLGRYFAIKNGYFNFEENCYWAAVIDAYPPDDIKILERHASLSIDLCHSQEVEGYQAGLKDENATCPYPYESLKHDRWYHGKRRGASVRFLRSIHSEPGTQPVDAES